MVKEVPPLALLVFVEYVRPVHNTRRETIGIAVGGLNPTADTRCYECTPTTTRAVQQGRGKTTQNLSFRFRPVNLESGRTSLPCLRCLLFFASTQSRLLKATLPLLLPFARELRLSRLPA